MTDHRVLIDGYFYGKPYGFGRFTVELVSALSHASDGNTYFVAVPAGIATPPDDDRIKWIRGPKTNIIHWQQIYIPQQLRELGCNALHSPCNTEPIFGVKAKRVVTVHDVMFVKLMLSYRRVSDFAYSLYSTISLFFSLVNRSYIVAVSEATRGSIGKYFKNTSVIYNTVDEFLAASDGVCADSGYILHRGGQVAHKNTPRVLAAFDKIRATIPSLRLKIVGLPPMHGYPVMEGVEYVTATTDNEIAQLYRGAVCLVMPSLMEGFGLPIIEAFGFGTAVITSNRDPMKEVAGNAAILVDPEDEDSLAVAMADLVRDEGARERLRQLGKERSSLFSAETLARSYAAAYSSANNDAPSP